MKALDVQDRLEYARAGVAVLRACKLQTARCPTQNLLCATRRRSHLGNLPTGVRCRRSRCSTSDVTLDDPLEAIDRLVPWESFRAEIEAVMLTPDELKKSSAGRKPFDARLAPSYSSTRSNTTTLRRLRALRIFLFGGLSPVRTMLIAEGATPFCFAHFCWPPARSTSERSKRTTSFWSSARMSVLGSSPQLAASSLAG
jgi:hypothetical protein